MKTTPNVTFTVPVPTEKDLNAVETITTAKMLVICLQSASREGMDLAAMRARLRVLDVAEKAVDGGEIVLEDADHATAVEAIRTTRWTTVRPHIAKFAELFGL